MRCEIYKDIEAFAEKVLPYVKAYETQNNLLLANINRELQGMGTNDLKILVTDDDDQMILVGVQVNPYNVTLAERDNQPSEDAIELLVKTLYDKQIEVPGCIAVEDLANRFTDAYTALFNKQSEEKMGLNLLQAYTIKPPHHAKGKLRLATMQDLHYLPYWGDAFSRECGLYTESIEDYYKKFSKIIEQSKMYIWEDEVPVSVCTQGRAGEKGVAISFVYTPPYYRNKGYAGECVAWASEAILEKGYEHCFLFADQNNPISNKIYQRVGYEMMGVTKSIIFEDQ